MKLEQIEYVVEISKTKSISRAAANLYISQPKLSLSIRQLEEELGSPVFFRTNKGIELTPFGAEVVTFAQTILIQINQLKTMAPTRRGSNLLTLQLANMHYRHVNHALSKLFNKYTGQDVRFEVREGPQDAVMNMVYDGTSEIGIIGVMSHYQKVTMRQMESQDIQYYRMAAHPLTIAVGRNNPLFSQESNEVDISQLADCPLVLYREMDAGPHSAILKILGLQNTPSRIVVTERETLHDVMEKTNCFAITDTNMFAYANTDYYPYIRPFVIKDSPITCEIGWIKRKKYHPSVLALEFIEILSKYYTPKSKDEV